MARRAIEVRDIVELMVHWHAGRRIGEESASLGVDPKTIRKYTAPAIEAGLVPGDPSLSVEQWSDLVAGWFPELADRSARATTWPEIEQHRERIKSWLGVVTIATIHQRLRDDHQLTASESSLRRDPTGLYCMTGVAGHDGNGDEICNGAGEVAANVENAAVTVGTQGAAECIVGVTCANGGVSIAQQHPEATQGVVDYASGALSLNPITAATNGLGWSDTGQYANTCSGWYKAGQVSMLAVDVLTAGEGFAEAGQALSYSRLFARGGGLNANAYLRIGWGWKGTAADGYLIFRIAVGSATSFLHYHHDFL